jgi:hypothetical protein
VRLNAAHKLLGVVFVLVLLAGVWLTYAVFSKKFTDYDEVRLQTSTIARTSRCVASSWARSSASARTPRAPS